MKDIETRIIVLYSPTREQVARLAADWLNERLGNLVTKNVFERQCGQITLRNIRAFPTWGSIMHYWAGSELRIQFALPEVETLDQQALAEAQADNNLERYLSVVNDMSRWRRRTMGMLAPDRLRRLYAAQAKRVNRYLAARGISEVDKDLRIASVMAIGKNYVLVTLDTDATGTIGCLITPLVSLKITLAAWKEAKREELIDNASTVTGICDELDLPPSRRFVKALLDGKAPVKTINEIGQRIISRRVMNALAGR